MDMDAGRETIFDVEWHRVVLDEGHIIRNYNSGFAKGRFYSGSKHHHILQLS